MKLEIDGKEANKGNQVISITRRVLDVENPSARFVDITNRFNLPFVQENHAIFKGARAINSDNDNFDKVYPAKIVDQFFLFNGIGFLTDTSQSYRFQLSEASKDLFDQMDAPISDLDFESDDFTFNQTSYDNLKTITSSVWVWPVINMHTSKLQANTRFTSGADGLKYSRPCFNFAVILKKIFESRGWTLQYDEDIIDAVAFSSNTEQFYVTSYQKTLDSTFNLSGEENITGLNSNDFENGVSVTNTIISISSTPTIFRLRGDVSTDTDVTITIIMDDKRETFVIESGQASVDFESGEFTAESGSAGDTQILISGNGTITFEDTLLYTLIEEQDLGDLSTNPLVGYRVKAHDNFPDKSQMDIFQDAMKLVNGYIEPDSMDKIITIKSLKNPGRKKDWSEKFIQQSEKIKNRLDNLARTNYLSYDNDETITEAVGRDSFKNLNESLNESETYLQFGWGASRELIINSQDIADFEIYNDTERVNDLNHRLVYLYDNGTYTIGRFFQISWPQLRANYYEKFVNSLERVRHIECLMNLNKLDVISHDFSELVYIKHFRSWFFVLIMDNFVPKELTKVELLRIS